MKPLTQAVLFLRALPCLARLAIRDRVKFAYRAIGLGKRWMVVSYANLEDGLNQLEGLGFNVHSILPRQASAGLMYDIVAWRWAVT